MSTPDVIDAHHHLWTADYPWLASEPELEPIRRDYGVNDLRANLKAAGVDRTVLVEAGWGHPSETVEFLHLAGAVDEIAGVVGLHRPARPAPRGHAGRATGTTPGPDSSWACATRSRAGPTPTSSRSPRCVAALKAIAETVPTFDLIVRVDQLPAAAKAAAAVPELAFVLDHLGKPQVRDGDAGLKAWREAVAPFAKQPNATAKLSGLVTEADWQRWTSADLRPFVQAALELFGPDRLMFGSDWPVCELAATYSRVKEALTEVLGRTDPDVFGGTAARTYQLGEQ